jgi:hypothetical protein
VVTVPGSPDSVAPEPPPTAGPTPAPAPSAPRHGARPTPEPTTPSAPGSSRLVSVEAIPPRRAAQVLGTGDHQETVIAALSEIVAGDRSRLLSLPGYESRPDVSPPSRSKLSKARIHHSPDRPDPPPATTGSRGRAGTSPGLIHFRPAPSRRSRSERFTAGQDAYDRHRTPVRTVGKRVGGNPSRVRISYPPPVPHRARCRRAPPSAVGPFDVFRLSRPSVCLRPASSDSRGRLRFAVRLPGAPDP